MPRKQDVTGQRFTRLVVEAEAPPNARHHRRVVCRCDCGVRKIVDLSALRVGDTQSCGCLNNERVAELTYRHGMTTGKPSPEYQSWGNMIQRCTNPKSSMYRLYGARGIIVCDRWLDAAAFLSDMGRKPTPRHTIERINSDGPYAPENCRWATPAEQSRNTSRTRKLTLNGETLCLTDWADRIGIRGDNLRRRLTKGWSVERALTTPPRS